MSVPANIEALLIEAVAWVSSLGGRNDRDALLRALIEGRKAGPIHQLQLGLASSAHFKAFSDAHLYVGETCLILDHERVAEWLVLSATEGSPSSSLEAIEAVAAREPISATAVLALARVGLPDRGPIDLGHGVSLRHFSANEFFGLPPLAQVNHHDADVHHISAALTVEIELPVFLLPAGSSERHSAWRATQDVYFRSLGRAFRALLTLGIVRPQPPALVGRVLLVSPGLPGAMSPSLASHIEPDTAWPRLDLTPPEVTEAISAFAELERLEETRRDDILIPMRRLRSAMTETKDFADAAIDLGIALESLLVRPDESSEITYRLSMRGAALLGATPDDRVELKKRLAKIYSMRSSAAHRGGVPHKIKGSGGGESDVLLHEGFRLAAAAIRKLLLLGCPTDLDRLLLSGPSA